MQSLPRQKGFDGHGIDSILARMLDWTPQRRFNLAMQSLVEAVSLIASFDPELYSILALTLKVSLGALVIACAIGFPLGAWLAISQPPGKRFWIGTLNALMGLPPVVVGLGVYLLLSRQGLLGWMELLYSPTAMIIAQCVLITPIIAALTHQALAQLERRYRDLFRSLQVSKRRAIQTYLIESREALGTCAMAGFGRALAEVGAVIIVGGNIDDFTRVLTTSIALETSRGNLSLAMALGLVLLTLSLTVNLAVSSLRSRHD